MLTTSSTDGTWWARATSTASTTRSSAKASQQPAPAVAHQHQVGRARLGLHGRPDRARLGQGADAAGQRHDDVGRGAGGASARRSRRSSAARRGWRRAPGAPTPASAARRCARRARPHRPRGAHQPAVPAGHDGPPGVGEGRRRAGRRRRTAGRPARIRAEPMTAISTGDELVATEPLLGGEVDDDAAQDALAVLAARVERERPADPGLARGTRGCGRAGSASAGTSAIASRTAELPTPVITGAPPLTTGRKSASSSIAWSIGVSFGGTCRLKIARLGSASLATSASIAARRSSSSSSRGEAQGVRLE